MMNQPIAVCAPRMASGVIVLDRHGKTTFATPAGEAWCDILKDGSDALPGALLAAAAQARTNETGAGNVYVPTSFGTIRVDVSRADESGSLAVVPHSGNGPSWRCRHRGI